MEQGLEFGISYSFTRVASQGRVVEGVYQLVSQLRACTYMYPGFVP
jgi:hypothetical protein